MRKRLTAAFLLLALTLLGLFVGARMVALHGVIRDGEVRHLQQDAGTIARVVETRIADGGRVDSGTVDDLVPRDERAWVTSGAGRLVVSGTGFDAAVADGDRLLSARRTVGGTTVVLEQDPAVVRSTFSSQSRPVLVLGGLLVVLAGAAGYAAATLLSRPFQRLAAASESLGRGRFDLDLPRSRIPEVRAVATSLERSAARVQRALKRDRQLLAEASHRMRTPITGMRLELEGLQLHPDLDHEARGDLKRVLEGLDQLQALTTEILSLASPAQDDADGVRLSLEELARSTAHSWSAVLATRHVDLDASVNGDLRQQLTPGPVEQVLDLLLVDLRDVARGTVTLSFVGGEDQVSVQVRAEATARVTSSERGALARVRAMVEALDGRCSGDPVGGGVTVWLPRR